MIASSTEDKGGNATKSRDAVVHCTRKITPYFFTAACTLAAGCSMETSTVAGTWHATSSSTSEDAGVVGQDAGASMTPTAEMDDGPSLAAIANNLYKTSPAFTKVTSAPYASSATAGAWIDVWVSTQAYAAYAAIRPDMLDSRVELPAGAMIVREVMNAQNQVTKLTLMIKGPSGYNPSLGDWWFGVTDPNGAPLSTDGGMETGRIEACFSCHIPRKDDGYLFGVEMSARAPHP